MKTSQNSGSLLSKFQTFLLIAASAFLIPSCEKEEMQTQSSGQSDNTHAAKLINEVQPYPVQAFESITINHIAALSKNPDYTITVYASGAAIYEGHRNVHIMDTRKFEVDKRTLEELKELSLRSNFLNIRPVKFNALDMPSVKTTFISGEGELTIEDDFTSPRQAVEFRTKVESKLNIRYLVYGSSLMEEATINR